jgi:DNA-binding GntR family transcriptional regulator
MSGRARDAIAEELRRLVITGRLAPGSLATETHLMSILGCGRTPLREALQELSQQGMVQTPPRGGIRIPQLGIPEFQQALEASLILGGACAKLAAARLGEEQVAQLMELLARQERANKQQDFYAMADLDCRFHVSIAEAVGNQHLTGYVTSLHTGLLRFTFPAYVEVRNAAMSIDEHRRIVEALQKRDPELAESMIREHLLRAGQRVLSILGLPATAQLE